MTDSAIHHAAVLVLDLTRQLEQAYPGMVEKFSPQRYIAELESSRTHGGYSRVPIAVSEACERIASEMGSDTLDMYHRLVLATLIVAFDQRRKFMRLPESIVAQYAIEFHRILAQFDTAKRGFHLHGNDLFAKDLAICRGKLLPCGAELVDVLSGVPRSLAFKGGVAQLFEFTWYFSMRLGGFHPFYEMHLDPRSLTQFTPRGWDHSYRCIADLLELNPGVRGVFGSSWWFDPEVERVTPNIGFLRQRPLNAGARIFRVGTDDGAIRNATKFSRIRKDLYEQGRYLPCNYLMVWAREDLLRWAREAYRERLEV